MRTTGGKNHFPSAWDEVTSLTLGTTTYNAKEAEQFLQTPVAEDASLILVHQLIANIIAAAADRIDARQFNPAFPQPFPRFVQNAIWQYCSQSGFDICNGNRIDDTRRCANISCRVRLMCDRVALRNQALATSSQ